MNLGIAENVVHSFAECFKEQGIALQQIIEDARYANFLFRQIRHMAIPKPHKRRKNSQYSKPCKHNYPYWKDYPYDNGGINVVKMVDVKCDFASGNDYTAIRGNDKIKIIENTEAIRATSWDYVQPLIEKFEAEQLKTLSHD